MSSRDSILTSTSPGLLCAKEHALESYNSPTSQVLLSSCLLGDQKKNQGKEPVVYSFTDLSNLVKWLSKKQVPNGIFVVGQEAVFWLQLEFKPVLASICTLELIIMLPLFTKKIGGMMNLGLLGLGSHVSLFFFFFPCTGTSCWD